MINESELRVLINVTELHDPPILLEELVCFVHRGIHVERKKKSCKQCSFFLSQQVSSNMKKVREN